MFMRKKFTQIIKVTMLTGFCSVLSVNAQGVYQLPNSDFEQWEAGVKLDGTVTIYEEPVGWNSFGTGSGSLIGTAVSAMKNWARKGNRGTTEQPNYYAIIYTGSFIGIKGNGNMTTGIISAGHMTPDNAANHNYTPTESEGAGADNFRQKFTGRPDAMKVSLKYVTKGKTQDFYARVSAWLHNGSAKFQDPHETDMVSKAVGNVLIEPSYEDAKDWTEFVADFNYPEEYINNNPEYILISTTSNRTPGKGNAADSLYIDDLYFIYHSSISDLKVKGKSIEGFNEAITEYELKGDAPSIDDIEVVCKSKWATLKTPLLKATKNGKTVISIEVNGNDYEISGNSTVYTLTYTPDSPVGLESDKNQAEKVFVADKVLHVNNYVGKVEIYDLVGSKFLERTTNTDLTINLPAGVYVVRTTNGSTTIIVK